MLRKYAKIPSELSSTPIEELKLSTRAYNALRRAGVLTLGQLIQSEDSQLLKLDAFGAKSLGDVKRSVTQLAAASPDSTFPSSSNQAQKNTNVSVDILDLSVRTRNVLKIVEIQTIADLLRYPRNNLLNEPNFGRTSLAELEDGLERYLSGGMQSKDDVGIKVFVTEMLSHLPERDREVVADRYGLWDGISETLQDIGNKLGITRERVRQIEVKSFKRFHRLYGHGVILAFFRTKLTKYLALNGERVCGLISKDEIEAIFSDGNSLEEGVLALNLLIDVVPNLLSLELIEAESGVYCTDVEIAARYKSLLRCVEQSLEHHKVPLSEQQLYGKVASTSVSPANEQRALLGRLLEVSPSVVRLRDGTVARPGWPGVRGRNATSLAVAVLRVLGKAAHFREITAEANVRFLDAEPVNERAIHSAMIRSPDKFVWVKNGTWGLSEWGMKKAPYIKDRLIELLSTASYPLPLWYLKEKVLEVCNCREASVGMTLNLNPTVFRKFKDDQFTLV